MSEINIEKKTAITYIVPAIVIVLTSWLGDEKDLLVAAASMIVLQIGFIYQNMRSDLRGITTNLGNIFTTLENTATIEPIREPNFHDKFQIDMRNSSQRVFITYFKNEIPYESNNQEIVRYYKNFSNIIENKRGEDVHFRRIIRGLPELEEWVDRLLEEREGFHNYSLACILDESNEPHLEGHVPIQLVDDDITYFVAVGQQRETDAPRDIFVRSNDMNTQWSGYYERLWDNSLPLIIRGEIQEDNVEKYKDHIQDLR